jgi:hypothetical protein
MVNTGTKRGAELVKEVLSGNARYPDEFSRHMSTAKLIFETGSVSDVNQLKDHVLKAFELRPGPTSMFLMINTAMQVPPIRKEIQQQIRAYLDRFMAERQKLQKRSGYIKLSTAAMMAADHLARLVPEKRSEYTAYSKELQLESRRFAGQSIW